MASLGRRRNGHPGPSAEEQHERSLASTEHSTAQSAAMSGTGQGFDPQELASREFIDLASDPDVDRDDLPKDHPKWHDMKGLLAAEFSRQFELGNISRRYWKEQRIMNRARAIATKMEFVEQNGLGSKCADDTRRRMTGGRETETRTIDPDLARNIDRSYDVATLKLSKSVGGWFLSKIADMTVNTRSEGFQGESSDDGWTKKIAGALRGS